MLVSSSNAISIESANHADSDVLCIARATVEAVGLLLALPVVLHLREARLDVIGGQSTVLVAVDLVESRRTETLLGACAARHNRQQSIVHAVLAAFAAPFFADLRVTSPQADLIRDILLRLEKFESIDPALVPASSLLREEFIK